MRKKCKRILTLLMALFIVALGFGGLKVTQTAAAEDTIVLRICSWEEYIDEGDWDEDEVIDLESGDIIGENSMLDDFCDWYYEVYGKKVVIEYSTFGTNEELYSQLTLGDTYDLICPSDYMIMKLMTEGKLTPLSEDFFDEDNEYNYYIKGVSPFIRESFEEHEIHGEAWSEYAACFMWGTTGIVYNPDYVDEEDTKSWDILMNEKYYRQITVKDSVRETMIGVLGIYYEDEFLDPEFIASETYHEDLMAMLNDTSEETVAEVEKLLKQIRANVYSFETDSGKADMVTGKVLVNYQWSGDAVYTMDQAEEDEVYLYWAVPEGSCNMWFDGWVMLKDGINGDAEKQQAAEAFINFVSRPDNAIRNMYYIGYTSSISGGDDGRIYEYLEWNYGADEEADPEELVEYPLGYFFSGDAEDEDYVLLVDEESTHRQLLAQYPTQEIMDRSAIMLYFDDEANARVNQMWINVRCFNLSQISTRDWIITGIVIAGLALVIAAAILIKKLYVRSRVAARIAAESKS